jgi:hypothetical protein
MKLLLSHPTTFESNSYYYIILDQYLYHLMTHGLFKSNDI